MLVEKPIAFESLDFLPGFPTISKFACNPFSTNFRTGACANPPVTVGRERTPLNGWPAVTAAIVAAGGQVPNYSGGAMAGLGSGEHGESYHRRPVVVPALSGAAGVRHLRWQEQGYQGNNPPASTSRNDHPHYHARLGGGCGCGGSCGSCGGGGLGFTFDPTSIMSWVTANLIPLAVGGALVYFLKRR